MNCPICNTPNPSLSYQGVIRDGTYGSFTSKEHTVLLCKNCETSFLSPLPTQVKYDSQEYRLSYNGSIDVNKYYELHDKISAKYLDFLSDISLRNKLVCDIGCGGGAFLDYIKGLCSQTVGVEPFRGYHDSLQNRGHLVFDSLKNLYSEYGDNTFDIIVSFHVIEHVENPNEFINTIYNLLKKDGVAIIVTPNSNDILMKLGPTEFKAFYYRTAHLYYFTQQSLKQIAKNSKFLDYKITFNHNYDFSNFVSWLNEKKPTGVGKLSLFNQYINQTWINFLIDNGLSEEVALILYKD
jgi:2-polyprenyl-3-methyl-5-hydroxy-6-metoxy-1,4-benzoquinol methylase